jgi:uncharacterized membrane protein YgdD (TMEM256/DUF423 family)
VVGNDETKLKVRRNKSIINSQRMNQSHFFLNVSIQNWNTAAHYQIIQGVALLAISSIPTSVRRIHPAAQPLIMGGTIMFSGTIYLLTLKREKFRALGPVTPLGGLAMMAGWAALLL